MKTKRIFILAITAILCLSLSMPSGVLAGKGDNDFTASLKVSDTSVPKGTAVSCTISIKNTDSTYGCDVSVSTAGGALVSSFYLAPGASRNVNHSVTINSTTNIYYRVYASHGPDISKTKNTNTVTVSVEQSQSGGGDSTTPNDDIIIDTPEIEHEPVHGVPKSGSLFVVSIENVEYDGMAIEGSCEVMTPHGRTVTMTGEIHYHLPDSIAAGYLDRTEDEYCYILANWRMGALSADAMDEIDERYILTTDDGVIPFSQDIALHDVPLLYDDVMDTLIITADMVDPTDGNRANDYLSIGLVYGPELDDEYTISLDELYFNGDLITDTSDVIEVEYGQEFTISQNVSYTISADELAVHDIFRTRVDVLCYLDGDYPSLIRAPYTSIIPDSASGDLVFELVADRASYHATCLDYGEHTIQITARHERDALPMLDVSETVMITINVVDEVTEPDDAGDMLELFDGPFYLDLPDWLGIGDNVELTLDTEEMTVYGETEIIMTGEVDFRATEEFFIRVSGDGFWFEHHPASYIAEGTALYENTEFVTETTEFELVTELISLSGDVLARDVDYLTVNVLERDEPTDYRQRFCMYGEPLVIGLGEDVTFNYHLSNEVTDESVHVQLIDNDDDSIIFEDASFEPLEMVESYVTHSPRLNKYYSFTARVLSDTGAVLWEQTMGDYVVVMPNHDEDGEASVFDLNLGASSLEIAPDETVRVYGAIDYGSVDHHLASGEIDINVVDQDSHVLHFETGVAPRELVAFFEDYVLTETTTFVITATGTTATGEVFEDTDEITIEVAGDAPGLPDDDSYPMEFEVRNPIVAAIGEVITVTASLENLGTENVSTVIFEDDGTFFADEIGYLFPGDMMIAEETFVFTGDTTFNLRAVAWAEGDTVVFTETIPVTIVEGAVMSEGDVEYALGLTLAARDTTIIQGADTEVYIDVVNRGTSICDIEVVEVGGETLFEGSGIAPGERFDNVLIWAPRSTSHLRIEVHALDADGMIAYATSESVIVNVIEPVPMPPSDAMARVDITVTPSIAAVETGGSVEYEVTVENTGEVDFYQYVVSESLTGSNRISSDLMAGETRRFTVDYVFTRDTSIVFDVRAFSEEGMLLAADSQMVTVEMLAAGIDEPLPEDVGPRPDVPEGPMMDRAEPREEQLPDEEIVFAGGIELSLEPLAESVDDGRMIIISDEETAEQNQRIYLIRRIIALAVVLILILIVLLIIIRLSKIGRNEKHGK